MSSPAVLVLEDGTVYEGYSFGAEEFAYGEVVFNTSMTGYQEMLTDPSYAGQILVLTYPLIGNYGINDQDFESPRLQVSGFVVHERCAQPSHWQSQRTLHQYLAEGGVPGIYGVDTRALTRRLRYRGVMMGAIASNQSPGDVLERLRTLPRYDDVDFVKQVTAQKPYEWESGAFLASSAPHVVVVDCGVKLNILRILHRKGCRVTVVPCTYSAEQILGLGPDGLLLSPGPGDPALLGYIVDTIKKIIGLKPLLGICLGEQIIGRAFGAGTFKLKFGHRGGNHPVLDVETGRVHIAAQNHGYAVDPATLKDGLVVSHLNLNDGTVEGLAHQDLPIMSIQYHSEASPGPQDNLYLFDQFLAMVQGEGG
jgi:carbamoyl-phosphate synthase small subunit